MTTVKDANVITALIARLMAICWTSADAEQICKALNGGAAHD